MTTENWLEKVNAENTFRSVDMAGLAQRMLQRNHTNRIVLPGKQATLLIALRLMASRLSRMSLDNGNALEQISNDGQRPQKTPAWQWLNDFADMVENYQLTIGAPENSRKQFLAALKRELQVNEGQRTSPLLGRH